LRAYFVFLHLIVSFVFVNIFQCFANVIDNKKTMIDTNIKQNNRMFVRCNSWT